MTSFKYNGSGCPDPTAYEALKRIQREEQRMRENGYRDGSIVTVETPDKNFQALVIKDLGSYASTIRIYDQPPRRHGVEIEYAGFIDLTKLTYTHTSMIVSRDGSIGGEIFENIKERLANLLGLTGTVPQPVVHHDELDTERLADEITERIEGCIRAEVTELHESLISETAKAEALQQILDRVLERGGLI